ncbi:MAG: type I-E CRISPR-associated protein Cse1/CasA [Verrucomicrobia bacterium]|nr:type I-E CRISPR-associated protein Cse1/CasA [Verrucomicrobiota bacterium]
MNLTIDPWIPVIGADGQQRMVSLHDLFAAAHELRDLSVKPHEKIALLRLLICITQAALDGPEDFDAWETCRDAIQPAVKSYLEQWQASFELFGDGPRFLQVPGLKAAQEVGEGNPATKLDLTLASGNNASLFDNSAGDPRTVEPGRLALTLLAFQCFAPGGRIGVAKWHGFDTPSKGASNHAPCTPSSMLHTFLQGRVLLETIHLNLLNKDEGSDLGPGKWGRPGWELPVSTAGDKAAIANATGSYLGRLVPLSRSIRLDAEGRQMILANGLDYPLAPIFREPAATMVQREDGPAVLGVALGRSIWRQLPAITVKRRSHADSISGPLALRNIDGTQSCTLWIGALATDKAKIEDVVEAAYDVPAGMFRDAGRKLYEEGVALAALWQEGVSKSVKAYAGTMKLEPVPYDRARQHFWTAIEQHVPTLLNLASKPEEAGDLKVSEWGKRVKEAAHEAFKFACPHQTPRQIQAYAIGLQQLFLPKPKDPNAPAKKKAPARKKS